MVTAREPVKNFSMRRRMEALWRSLWATAQAPSGERCSGARTWEWPRDFWMSEAMDAPSSPVASEFAPRSQWYIRSPQTESKSLCMAGRSRARSSGMVRMPLALRRTSVRAPMPGRSRSSRWAMARGSCEGKRPMRPSGFCMSLAILAR